MKDRSELVERKHPILIVRKQCRLLGVARSSLAYARVAETPENLRIKRLLDENSDTDNSNLDTPPTLSYLCLTVHHHSLS